MGIRSLIGALTLTLLHVGAPAEAQDSRLVVVLVIDGLRPDVIQPGIMPNLARLKQEGAWFENSHSVFPTVTRVNSASISTGAFPADHGIVSNTMWVEGVSPKPFDTSNWHNLTKLADVSGGRTLPIRTLAETLEAAGVRFVAIGSGSTGGTFLLNPEGLHGNGVLINASFEEGTRVAYPDKVNQDIRARFGSEKSDAGIPSLLWAERVLRDYVLPELHPGVVIDWMTEPDGSQHRFGVGSPEALAALKATDDQIGLLLAKLRETGAGRTTDVIVTADHGFGAEPDPVDLSGALQASGKAGEVIVASNGASVFLYARNHSPEVIRAVTAQLEKTDGVDLLFTTAAAPANGAIVCRPSSEQGWIPGTFSLELIRECNSSRGADIVVTFEWSAAKNAFGYPGAQRIATNDKQRNVPGRSGHGGLNPYMVHTPLLLWGPDFREKITLRAPSANYDIAPTLLRLFDVTAPPSMRGRALTEGFAKGGAAEPRPRTRTITARSGQYCATLQVSTVGDHLYLDQGQRCR